ncbi:MAG: TnsA endonuclease N-terminal domain-containing protein [Chloroflexi bacterium]|nr:TnsA endonuclease N-terminal domain-containing protein [Chloroflexota bacterium]
MSVRKVSNHGGNVIGRFPSVKMKRMMAFESLIERDYLYLLDYDPDVEWFEEQPLTIEYQHDGETRHYTPDFHLVERERDILIECKPNGFVAADENRRKFAVARAWCRQRGWISDYAFYLQTGITKRVIRE